eukprot:7377300-Prymnesium_polylepis.1
MPSYVLVAYAFLPLVLGLPSARIAAWSARSQACGPAGSEGYILVVRDDGAAGRRLADGRIRSAPGDRYADKLRHRWLRRRSLQQKTPIVNSSSSNEILFTFRSALHGLAARLNETELDA